jgi:hypothetical protein
MWGFPERMMKGMLAGGAAATRQGCDFWWFLVFRQLRGA